MNVLFAYIIQLAHYLPVHRCDLKFNLDTSMLILEKHKIKGIFKTLVICFRKHIHHPTNRICEIVKQFIKKVDEPTKTDAVSVSELYKYIGEKIPWVKIYTSRFFIKQIILQYNTSIIYVGDGFDKCQRIVGYKIIE